MEEEKRQKVYFVADLHFHHKNILKHCPNRAEMGGFDVDDVEAHDKWLIDQWNSTIGKKDIVYIVGDFAFGSPYHVKSLLSKLHGKKFLILGNHDASSDKTELVNYCQKITQIHCPVFKKSNYEWLEEDFQVILCHYAMVTWPGKHYGSVMVHGHSHGRLNEYNDSMPDLRVDVGIDSDAFPGLFVEVKELYDYFKKKTNGEKFHKYAQSMKEMNGMPI